MRIGLIGHSHAVCLMDALGEWRSQLDVARGQTRVGYSEVFDGWDATDTGQKLLQLPNRRIGPVSADLTCAIVFGGSRDYQLVSAAAGVGKNVTISPTPSLVQAAEAFRQCDLIVSIMFGNELMTKIWLDDLPAYDFLEDTLPAPAGAGGAQPIDRRFIRHVLREICSRQLFTCLSLKQQGVLSRIVHVLPPPPLEDPTGLEHLEGFEEALAKYGALNPILRLKWYRAYVRVMRETLGTAGVPIVVPPVAAHTASGFFRKELANGLTHGNTQYGGMVWAEIGKMLKAAS